MSIEQNTAITCAECIVQEKKKGMAKMIDVTNKTHERREKCLAEVAALKAQADKEQAQFEAEWRKLGSLIDQDKRNRELVRQREMEERDRRTQEVRHIQSFALSLLLIS